MSGIADFFVTIGSKFDASGLNAATDKLEEFNKKTENLSEGFKKIGYALTAFAAVGTASIIAVTNAASEAEKVQLVWGQALKQVGKYSDEAYQHGLDYATALQKVSIYGDEAILSAETMLARFGAEGPMLDKLTKATLDFASAKGIDLSSAANLVAKTVGSETNALARYGIEITGAKGSTERMQSALDGISELFGGAAAAAADTFEGKIAKLKNQFDDFEEKIGGKLIPIFSKVLDAFGKAVDWLNNLSPEMQVLISMSLLLATALASVLGPLALFIGFLPALTLGLVQVSAVLKTLIAFLMGPVGITIAIAAVIAGIVEYLYQTEKMKNRDMEIVQTKKQVLDALIKNNAEIKEQIKSFKVTGDEAERLATQYNNQKVAITKLTAEIKNNSDATKNESKARKESIDLAIEFNKQTRMDENALNKFNEVVAEGFAYMEESQKATEGNTDALDNFNRVVSQGQENLDEMTKAQKETQRAADETAISWMNMAMDIIDAGGDMEQTFNAVVSGVAGMFDPATGAAILLGGTILDKLLFGNKKPKSYYDEQLDLIDKYIASIKPKWGQLAIDISKIMADAFQFGSLTASWNDFVGNLGKKFKSMIMENVAASILKMPAITAAMAKVSDYIGTLAGIEDPKVMEDALKLVKNKIGLLLNTISPVFASLQGIISGLDLDKMFEGIYTPKPIEGYWPDVPKLATGGIITAPQLVLAGESGPEAIIPLPQMGQMGGITLDIHDNYFSDQKMVDKFGDMIINKLKNVVRI